MSPTFDFAAFLNHSPPNGNDVSNGFDSAVETHAALSTFQPTGQIQSATQIAIPQLDHATLVSSWAPPLIDTEIVPKVEQVDVSMPFHEESANPDTTLYRSGIAHHHLSKLRHCVPLLHHPNGAPSARLGGPGQSSVNGSYSSPSVPLSQSARVANIRKTSDLTIQERRRLARRERKPSDDHPSTTPSAYNGSAISPIPATTPKSEIQMERNVSRKLTHPINESPLFNTKYSDVSSNLTKRAYSYTGFDMVGALMRVMTRPNPTVDIGPVDLSCSFTVSDAQHPDQPIVHCSDTFCTLTGYNREEIIGRNCRFLQAPDGNVEAGTERMHTDNDAVQHFRRNCHEFRECQTSLINYRRDGIPFLNLVTVVPITWGDSDEPVFLVGFQVDLVEQPGAILERKDSGLYSINYSSIMGPQSLTALTDPHLLEVNEEPAKLMIAEEEEASKKVMQAQELSDLITCGSKDTSKWARLLLDNVHDLITVLSLKGTFLYVSPSVERLLGYKSDEMVGKSISEFCHPSDVVPVFRELKDSTSNASIAAAARQWARMDGTVNPPTKGGAGQTGPQVNLIMRMRHKERGYEWIENVGKLHLEQGKGRKVVISTGRPRPVYNLPWEQARRSLDYKGPAFWSKVSQSGLILSTSGPVGNVLYADSPSNNEASASIIGKHVCEVVDIEAGQAISNSLHSLNVTGIPHQMTNGMGGQAVTVMSTLIPSSAGGQGLPTVFMHTQRVSATDLGTLQLNKIHTQDVNVSQSEAHQASMLKVGEPGIDSVFNELSTQRSTSWVFELHQLKIANKRLREEIRCHQRRISGGKPIVMIPPPLSPIKSKSSAKSQANKILLSVKSSKGNASDSTSDASMALSPSPFHSGSGSGSDSSAPTSVDAMSSTENPVSSGFKRSRS